MKKSLVSTLALTFVLGVAGTAFAANPFVDVPAKHWSYDAVSKLAKDGIVTGYDDKTFKGDREITRYEMAIIVAKAMGKAEKANAEDKTLIEKLSVEYSKELNSLGVRVEKLETKVNKFDLSGTARVRYDKEEKVTGKTTAADHINIDINYSYKVNDEWAVKGESEWQRQIGTVKSINTTTNDQFEQLYVTGPISGTSVKVGRYSRIPAYGVLYDDKFSGAQVAFGNAVKTTIDLASTNKYFGNVTVADGTKERIQAIELDAPLSKVTNAKALFIRINQPGVDYKNAYEVGFDTKFGNDFSFKAAYAKSNQTTENKAYFAQVQYLTANANVPGSKDFYVAYRNFKNNATIAPTGDYTANVKGVRIGFDYVPVKNVTLLGWYTDGKFASTAGGNVAGNKDKVYRLEADFAF